MPIDPTLLAALKAATLTGRPPCASYIQVTWSSGVVHYYGGAAWNDEAPFTGIGHTIEPRLIFSDRRDPFHGLEINPDIRTEAVDVTFDDIDETITDLFETYESGVACEFILYYPDQTITTSIWQGQLQAPNDFGWTQLQTKATNGSRSREQVVPFRGKPSQCSFVLFGGLVTDSDARASNGCDYNPAGGIGLYKTGTTPFTDCPLDAAACTLRFGDLQTYGGFNTNASPTVSDPNPKHFTVAISRGNASGLKTPIRVVFGTKQIKDMQLWMFRPEPNTKEPAKGFVDTVFEVSEGPNTSISNFAINGKIVEQMHLNFRLGTRRQLATFYSQDVNNFNLTSHVRARFGWVDANATAPGDLSAECYVVGFSEVCVYTDATTKTRIWSDDRVWCLLEIYKNQRFGMGYLESKIEIADWLTASAWGLQTVSFTATFPDGETRSYISRRTSFNAVLEARPVAEQVEDICRAGGISVPFWHDGKLTISCFRAATSGELSAAKTFNDRTSSVNICWTGDTAGDVAGAGGGRPMLSLSKTPATKVINEVTVSFEDASKNGTERSIVVDDKNAKLVAGRQLGAGQFQTVPRTYGGFGIVSLDEAVRFGYRMLKYGEFDEGGTDNNLRLKMTVPFEQALGIKRYEIIKLVSTRLSHFTLAKGSSFQETPQYFRVLHLRRVAKNRMEIEAQAYNHTSYTAFETDSVVTPTGSLPVDVRGGGSDIVTDLYEYTGQTNSKPQYEVGIKKIYWNGSAWRNEVDGTLYYSSASAVAFPWLATWSTAGSGVAPVPIYTRGVYVDGGGCKVTLGSATYDTASREIVLDIDPC